MGYTNFGHQNESSLATLQDWLSISTSLILSNSRAASFMTSSIPTAHQQTRLHWKSVQKSTQKYPYSVQLQQLSTPLVMNVDFEGCGVSAYGQPIHGGTEDHVVTVHW